MELIVDNVLTIAKPSEEVKKFCEEKLIIDNPDYLAAMRAGNYTGHMPKKMRLYAVNGNKLILPFGMLNRIWKLIKNSGEQATYKNRISRWKGNNLIGEDIRLYGYQQAALINLKEGKNGILEAPCGSGKTIIGIQLIKSIGGKALWLTHTHKLLTQAKDTAEKYFKGDYGIISEGEIHIGKDITFATVQTLSSVDMDLYQKEFDMVVVDECHHCVGSPTKVMQFYKVVNSINCRYKYGLSATLNRSDNLISTLFTIIGDVLYQIKETDVGNRIIKAVYEPIHLDLKYDEESYTYEDGRINWHELLNVLADDKERNNVIINNIIKYLGRKQLVLTHRINHVNYLVDELNKRGIVASAITGSMPFYRRNYDAEVLVATFSLAKEGLDIPELSVLHLATPQKDYTTTRQSVGRVERNYEGKVTPIVLDYVDDDIPYCVSCFKRRKGIILRRRK